MKKTIVFCIVLTFIFQKSFSQWTRVFQGSVYSLVVKDDTKNFAATGQGVYLSTDNGVTWTAMNNGLQNISVHALAIGGNAIYAGTSAWQGGLFKSTDDGNNWTATSLSAGNYLSFFSLAANGNVIYASIDSRKYFSADGGNSWIMVDSEFPENNGLDVQHGTNPAYTLTMRGNTVFAGTVIGLFSSTNNGTYWNRVGTGGPTYMVKSIMVDGPRILTGTELGVFLSKDNGSSWVLMNNGLPTTDFRAVGMYDNYLLAGGYTVGVYLSSNNGCSWADITQEITNPGFTSFVTCGTNIFVGSQTEGIYKRALSDLAGIAMPPCSNEDSIAVLTDPWTGTITIQIINFSPEVLNYELKIFNILGSEVRRQRMNNNSAFEITKDDVSSGLYIYQLIHNSETIATGKIIMNKR